MADPRHEKLAKVLVRYSVGLKKGDKVVISGTQLGAPLLREVYREALAAGAHPTTLVGVNGTEEIFIKEASKEQLEFVDPFMKYLMKNADAFIGIGGAYNTKAMSNVDPKRSQMRARATTPLQKMFMDRTAKGDLRWTGTLFPTHAAAQDAYMSLSEHEDFVFRAMWLDKKDPVSLWRKLSQDQKKLIRKLSKMDKLRVEADGTELELRVKGRTWINGDGHENFPCGELFTAPIEDSVNGHIRFTYPAVYRGREVEDVRLEFKHGKCVKADAARNKDFLAKMLDIDAGARKVGEFAIGTNYGIKQFTRNTLFDEKIGGTIHMALGAAIPQSGGKNFSALHWDMVCDLRKGGRIVADGKVIHDNGKWKI